jgi:hypothetical protein
MIVSIHQPNYIPWLGYFFKIFQSDVFVFLDDVQFSNEGMHNFHYIKTPQGPLRLKIPVEQHLGDRIMDVSTKDMLGWKEKHLKSIEANYKKAAFFNVVYDDFRQVLLKNYPTLSAMNVSIIELWMKRLGICTKLVQSSGLSIVTTREEKVLDICSALHATAYCSGVGAKAYQKESDFTQRGLQLEYSIYRPFDYGQLWGGFQANVTVLDYLMNCGYDWQRVVDNQQEICYGNR